MNALIKKVFYNNGYLLIAAAWLFTLSFIFSNYWSYTASIKSVKSSIQEKIQQGQQDYADVLKDSAFLLRLAEDRATEDDIQRAIALPFGLYLYDVNPWHEYKLEYWNNQKVEPELNRLFWEDSTRLRNLVNGQYVQSQNKLEYAHKRVLAVALFNVREEYFIQNTYLTNSFSGMPRAESLYRITLEPNANVIKDLKGNPLFYLEYKNKSSYLEKPDTLSVVLRIAGIVMLLFFIQVFAEQVAAVFGNWRGIATLTLLIGVLRVCSYILPFPFDFKAFELFSPGIFASGSLQPSLGDLLINCLLGFWILLFVRIQLEGIKINFSALDRWKKWLLMIVFNCLLLAVTYSVCGTIRSMVIDSTNVSFNVTNFFSLNEYSIIGFVILACLMLTYFYAIQLLLKFIREIFPETGYLIYLVPAILGLLYLSVLSIGKLSGIEVFTLLWLVLIIWMLTQKWFFLSEIQLTFPGNLFWLFIFSASVTVVLVQENKGKELEQRKRLAEKLSLQADRSNERLLSIAMTNIDTYYLRDNFRKFLSEGSNRTLKEELINMNFSVYLNKYDSKFYTFDRYERPLFNEDSTSYSTLNTILSVQGKRTNIPGLFYYETAFDKFSYISKTEVTDTAGLTQGYVYFISKPKKYKGEALYPELFKQSSDYDPEYSPFYSYAIYSKNELINNYNEYPFPTKLVPGRLPVEDFKIINKGEYDELWYKVAADKYVVIAKKVNKLIEAITLFAYLFCSFLFLVALFRILYLLVHSRFQFKRLTELLQFNIRTQVHSTIIFISLFSFIVIGIATISFFINRYNNNNRDRLSRVMQIMVNEVQNKMSDNNIFKEALNNHSNRFNILRDLIDDVSELHNAEVNLYDLHGRLQVSSREIVYDKGILSPNLQPEAFYKLHNLMQVQVVQREHIGKLDFLSIYAPVRDEKGATYAYLNIPSFASERELNQEISNFLVTIINLNAFIFLVAGVISLFIANRITNSFSLIADKMKEVNLGKLNEEITWNRVDEIGDLVQEYNKMVRKLGESAVALAKSEREGAWREMARQVAHEIKNPLTPMKLSIQYLQKAIDSNSANVKELTSSVASTLIEQIEHLSKIASDFSQFANIGNPVKEPFDLHEMIAKLVGLYQSNEHLDIKWYPISMKLQVFQDKTQMNRLFTNLIQNALEAASDKKCIITITETFIAEAHTIRIGIQDNGEGISPEMQSKIFIPNFTTKTSGTGLGLAMCKSIAEQAKGRIWFETELGMGSTFYVEVPLA